MGCDIHIVAEVRGDDGAWRLVGESKVDEDGWITMPQPYSGRNYDLFGMLADVRNGRGFAGCDTGDGFVPISEPRGVPSDASDDVKKWIELWGVDGHSHSFHTVEQLLGYDWYGQLTRHRGLVSMPVFRHWTLNGRGRPKSWCGGVHGPGVKIVTIEEMGAICAELYALGAELPEIGPFGEVIGHSVRSIRGGSMSRRESAIAALVQKSNGMYTQVEWTETYADCAGPFLADTIPKLKDIGPPDRVRVVFFFDN